MSDRIYINDLVENKDGRLYIVSEINYDRKSVGVTSVPIGNYYAWVDVSDLKKIGNYPYLPIKLEYIEKRLEEFENYESFVLRDIANRYEDEQLIKKR